MSANENLVLALPAGRILTEVPEGSAIQSKYRFYM